MELLWLVAAILVVGVIVWGIDQFPIDATFKTVARVILIVALVIYAIYVIIGLAGNVIPPLRK